MECTYVPLHSRNEGVIISPSGINTWLVKRSTETQQNSFLSRKNICQTWRMQCYGTFIDAPESGSLMDIDDRTADMSRTVGFQECRRSSHSAKCCKPDGTPLQTGQRPNTLCCSSTLLVNGQTNGDCRPVQPTVPVTASSPTTQQNVQRMYGRQININWNSS